MKHDSYETAINTRHQFVANATTMVDYVTGRMDGGILFLYSCAFIALTIRWQIVPF